ncbi:hypothetical protein BTVI_83504 [Pitangus sulphuratus]|nr:hypothetical protein BTVI_83504 [Pitangus sulphuratus]
MLLELCQAWRCDHFPGESVPVANHPLHEEPFSNIQPKPSLTQLQTIPSGPVTGHYREEISAYPSSSSQEKVADCNEVSPQSPLLQAEQTKCPQLFLITASPQGPSPSSLPSFGHPLRASYLSYIVVPKTVHHIQGKYFSPHSPDIEHPDISACGHQHLSACISIRGDYGCLQKMVEQTLDTQNALGESTGVKHYKCPLNTYNAERGSV